MQTWLVTVQSTHDPLTPQAVSLVPNSQIPAAQQKAHGLHIPRMQDVQSGQVSKHCPSKQHPLGQGCSAEQAEQTLFTQAGVPPAHVMQAAPPAPQTSSLPLGTQVRSEQHSFPAQSVAQVPSKQDSHGPHGGPH